MAIRMTAVRRFFPLALLLGVVASPVLFAAQEAVPLKWSANVRVFEVALTPEAIRQQMPAISLPQLRVYDREGRRVFESRGYDADFAKTLEKLFQGKSQPTQHRLAPEIAQVRLPGNEPLPPLPAADFTLVEQWAEWCVPCHAQHREIARLLGSYSTLHFNLLHVESDPAKTLGSKKIVLDAETAKKLKDPSLTPEQKQKILREFMEKEHPEMPKPPG